MIMHNTRESAVRRDEFHDLLKQWLDDSFDATAGEADHHSGSAWLWVRHGGEHYYLDASATRAGIREYVRLIAASANEVEWQLPASEEGARERVTVGADGRSIVGFDLYGHVPRR